MSKNDYVSYEIAKKLKENGFREPCFSHFTNTGTVWNCRDMEDFNSYEWLDVYSRPTLWQAQKWLRNEKGIHIEIYVNIKGTWNSKVINLNDSATALSGSITRDSYEEALSAGIEAALEILNEKK